MTNLYFGFPDIPFKSIYIQSSKDYCPFFSYENLIHGQIYQGARLLEAVGTGSVVLTFDLGEGGDRACEYLFIADAKAAIDQFTTSVLLESSSNGSSWTSRYTDASFASATLVGPDSRDYFAKFAATSAFRYWRVTFANTTASNYFGNFAMRALYFGMLLDVGCAPNSWALFPEAQKQSLFRSGSDAIFLESSNNKKYLLQLKYDDLTDAEVNSVIDNLAKHKNVHNFLLYTDTFHDIINNHGILLMKLVEVERTANDMTLDEDNPTSNVLRLTFEEVI